MKLTTTEAQKRHAFNYFEYVETQHYYQCVTCSTVVEPYMGLKCHRLFRPKISKVKRRFFVENP